MATNDTEKKTQAKPAAAKAPAKKAASKGTAAAKKAPAKKAPAKKATASKPAAKTAPKKVEKTEQKPATQPKTQNAPKKAQKGGASEIAGTATTKYVRISPFKVRLVANKVRNKSVVDALTELNFIERGCVVEVEKVIKSAAANAYEAKGFRPEDLEIAEIMVDEGPTIKRFRPRAKGAASRINKRTSHITVSVRAGKEA